MAEASPEVSPERAQLGATLPELGRTPPELDPIARDRAKATVEARLLGADEVVPVKVGRFAILECFARGGMGLLYAAYDTELDRRVALKLLRPQYSDAAVRRRIVREAQAMAKLNHPNVAQIYDVGEDRGRTFIAIEFIRGDTLGRWRERERPGWREVIAVYEQAGRGLAAAHAVGLVHRDFKPENAMRGHDDGRVRVLDFGLARAVELEPTLERRSDDVDIAANEDALRTPLTRDGSIMGTPAYMAPEQHLGEVVDARADQFSFCVSLWEALYGERPFAGNSRTELSAAVVRGAIREPGRANRVPGWVRKVVERGLAVQPEQRFESITALLAALARDPTRRRRRILLAAATVTAASIGVGGWVLARQRTAMGCADEASLQSSWNDDTRERVREALLAVGPSYASSTTERVLPRLDAWAEQWSSVRERVCVETRVDGTLSSDVEERAGECLDEQRQRFDTLVGILATADEHVLERAASSTDVLADPGGCADEEELRRHAAPRDPALRDAVGAARRELAAAQAMLAADRPAEAAKLAASVLEQTALASHPVHAEALALAATAEVDDPARRIALGEQAALLALRLGAEEVAFDAIIGLMDVLAEPDRRERRGWWLELAQMLVDRLGAADGLRGAALQESQALALSDPHVVLERNQQALAIRERLLGPDHPLVGSSVSNTGAALEMVGDTAAAEEFHRRGLEIRELALGPDHPHVAVSLINAAQSYAQRRDFTRARELTARALEIWEHSLGPEHGNVALALGNLAGIAMSEDDHAGARPLLERAIAIIEKTRGPDSPYLVQHLANLATIHQRRAEYDEAGALFSRAIVAAESWKGPDGSLVAQPLLGAAGIALLQGRAVEAAGHAERALRIFETHRSDLPNLAHAHSVLARALWDANGDRARAHVLARQAVEQYQAFDGDWSRYTADIEQWIAEHPLPR